MSSAEAANLDKTQKIEKMKVEQLALLASDVARKIRSFDHFAYVWGEKGGFFLPPKRCLTWQYIAQLLSGEKKLLKANDVGAVVELPKVRGVRVSSLFEQLKSESGFGAFFPDQLERRSIPRTYFFNVLLEGHARGPADQVQGARSFAERPRHQTHPQTQDGQDRAELQRAGPDRQGRGSRHLVPPQ